MTNQSFDNEVKKKMSGHESPVPAGVWEAIEQKRKKRRYPVIWWWLAGAGIVLTGIVGVYAITAHKRSAEIAMTSEKEKVQKEKMAVPSNSDERVIHEEAVASQDQVVTENKKGSPDHLPVDSDQLNKQPGSASIAKVSETDEAGEKSIAITTGKDQSANKIVRVKQQAVNEPKARVLRNVIHTDKRKKHIATATGSDINGAGDVETYALVADKEDQQAGTGYVFIIDKKLGPVFPRMDHGWKNIDAGSRSFLFARADSLEKAHLKAPVKRLLQYKGWTIDIGVQGFIPVRQQQTLESVNRTIKTPLHMAEYKANEIKASLQPSMAYSMTVRKQLNKRWAMGVGLQYGVIKEHLELSGTETNTNYRIVQRLETGPGGPFLRTDTVAEVTTGIRTISAINSYRFFDIPVSVQYTLIDKPAFSLRWTGGINLGLYSHYNNSIRGDWQAVYSSGAISGKQRSTVRAEFYTGIRYTHRLFNDVSIFAEPYLRFNTGKYANTVVNNRSVHQAGAGVGLSFQVGRKK